MPDRAPGFYWVRDRHGRWVVAHWDGDQGIWYATGDEDDRTDSSFAEIGPRVESPEEASDVRATCLKIVEEIRESNQSDAATIDPRNRLVHAHVDGADAACAKIVAAIRQGVRSSSSVADI